VLVSQPARHVVPNNSVASFTCVCLCQLEAHGALVVQLKQEIARQSQLNAAQCRAWSEQNEVGRGSSGRVLLIPASAELRKHERMGGLLLGVRRLCEEE
jgi:hypothetical protein